MKILVCAGVDGDFEMLAKDAESINVGAILIAGNVGIMPSQSLTDLIMKKIKMPCNIYYVTGYKEDFGEVKKLEEPDTAYALDHFVDINWPYCKNTCPYLKDEHTIISIAGVRGTYSPKYYMEDSAPPRHMLKKNLAALPEGLDICLLHNVPGKLGKTGQLDFDLELFDFLKGKHPRYTFIGGYHFDKPSIFNYLGNHVVFLTSLKIGYAIIDTEDWSCVYNHKLID